MRLRLLLTLGLSVLCLASPALAQSRVPALDPLQEKGGIPGKPTQVLVLGTLHLGQTADSFQPVWLDPLLDRLAAWRPEIITTEGLSGQSCMVLSAYADTYVDAAKDYCPRILKMAALGQTATGLTMPAAYARAETLLAGWPASPTAAQRRELAAAFAAAGDIDSALVQWLRLPTAERRAGDGVDEALRAELDVYPSRKNENVMIAARLAARLGLERVYPSDDHTADSITTGMGESCMAAIEAVWAKVDSPEVTEMRTRQEALASGEDLLNFYRFLNTPKMQLTFIRIDHLANMRAPSPALCGRQYMAWWETRNLRMVANIRSAFGNQPGARVLSIVGVSHKPYFDAYLDNIHEVQLMRVEDVLR